MSASSRLKYAVPLPKKLFVSSEVLVSCAILGCSSLTMAADAGSMRSGQMTFTSPLQEIGDLPAPVASPVAGS